MSIRKTIVALDRDTTCTVFCKDSFPSSKYVSPERIEDGKRHIVAIVEPDLPRNTLVGFKGPNNTHPATIGRIGPGTNIYPSLVRFCLPGINNTSTAYTNRTECRIVRV